MMYIIMFTILTTKLLTKGIICMFSCISSYNQVNVKCCTCRQLNFW